MALDNPAHPAATVLVLRDADGGPEIFMVRRHTGTAFMAGQHVFPGGRVEAADREAMQGGAANLFEGIDQAARRLPGLPFSEAVGYHVAAARELFEEAGVLLARTGAGRFVSLVDPAARERFDGHRRAVHGGSLSLGGLMAIEHLRLALDALEPFAHWVTPPVDTRRFDTRFFVARVPPDQTPSHDELETTDSVWISPRDALDLARRGGIVLPPPTWTTMRELEPFGSVDAILASLPQRDQRRREPALVQEGDARVLVMPDDPGHPDHVSSVPFETRFVWRDGQWRAT